MTFSRSLAEYLARVTGTTMQRVQLRLGRTLAPGEKSSTGLYALVSLQKGTILRVSCIHEFAHGMVDPEWRTLVECRANLC